MFQIIMMVGLPGTGKTTWALKQQKELTDKRYNIIGTDSLIDRMKVNGLPRRNNFHGRWEVLIQKATTCLNKLFQIGMYFLFVKQMLLWLEEFNLKFIKKSKSLIGLSQ